MTQITIIDFIFQISLRKHVNNFTKGIVPQPKGIEVPMSAHRVICVGWE